MNSIRGLRVEEQPAFSFDAGVDRFRRCTRALIFLGLAVGSVGAAPLPFTLTSADSPWHTIKVQKPASFGPMVEALVLCTNVESRFVILSEVDDPTDGENLASFARRIKGSLRPRQQMNALEEEETKMGFTGTDLKFEIADPQHHLSCEVFTFVNDYRRWGMVFLIDQVDAAKVPEPFNIFRAVPPVPKGVVGLLPFNVKDDPLTAFPISFSVKPDRSGLHVEKLTVTVVPSPSETEEADVREGDEIISVNGKRTSDFSVGLGKTSELGRIFLNRHPGDEVALEFVTPGAKKSRIVVLHIAHVGTLKPSWTH